MTRTQSEALLVRRGATSLDYQTQCVGRALRGVGDAAGNHEGLTFTNSNMPGAGFLQKGDHNVTLQLQKELFTVRDVKVVPCIGTRNAHGKEVLTVIEVLVGDRRAYRLDSLGSNSGDVRGRATIPCSMLWDIARPPLPGGSESGEIRHPRQVLGHSRV